MSFGQRVLGKTLFEFLLRKTMYSQFVAGETLPAIQDTIKLLRDCGIGTMLCVPNEEDVSTDYENFKDRWGYNSLAKNKITQDLGDWNMSCTHSCIRELTLAAYQITFKFFGNLEMIVYFQLLRSKW